LAWLTANGSSVKLPWQTWQRPLSTSRPLGGEEDPDDTSTTAAAGSSVASGGSAAGARAGAFAAGASGGGPAGWTDAAFSGVAGAGAGLAPCPLSHPAAATAAAHSKTKSNRVTMFPSFACLRRIPNP
jgi:hypothetical protein